MPGKIRSVIRGSVLLTGVLILVPAARAQQQPAQQQQPAAEKFHVSSTDVAVTYDLVRAKIATVNGNGFWLNGGSVEGVVNFQRGLSVVANLTGERASNIAPGVGLSKILYLFGPRYSYSTTRWTSPSVKKHGAEVFGEFLLGGAHGFDSTFPAAGGATSSASSIAMQMGGGLDVALARGFGLRALELDYVRTTLPNNASNSQNDFRIAFGVTYRFKKR
jgi:peptidoglycan-associated lipoprotein